MKPRHFHLKPKTREDLLALARRVRINLDLMEAQEVINAEAPARVRKLSAKWNELIVGATDAKAQELLSILYGAGLPEVPRGVEFAKAVAKLPEVTRARGVVKAIGKLWEDWK